MKGIVNHEILKGISKKLSPRKIKKILKEDYKIVISNVAFKLRYDAIKARLN